MRGALGLATLLGFVACGGEARKLGEVDVTGGFGGFGGFGGAAVEGLGGFEAGGNSGGTPVAFGGSPITVDPGGSGAAGMEQFNGGAIQITEEQRTAILSTACAGSITHAETGPTLIDLVVDVSASMNQTELGNGLSNWAVTRDELIRAVLGVGEYGLSPATYVGLLLYPDFIDKPDQRAQPACSNSSGRVLPAMLGLVGSPQRALLEERLASVVPAGVTPTLEAYTTAAEQLRASPLVGPRFLMLVTDGAATSADCRAPGGEQATVDPAPIVQAIATTHAQRGIKTFVVGTPGSEPNARWLSEAAVRGGTAPPACSVEAGTCHMPLSDLSSSLNDRLASTLGSSLIACTFDLAVPPGEMLDLSQIHIFMRSSAGLFLLLRSTDPDCTTGWRWTEDRTISLCSESCRLARESEVQLVFGCVPLTAK